MNRYISIITIALLLASCTAAKNSKSNPIVKNAIRTDFMSYLQSIIDKDFQKSTDYISPEIFEIIPRQSMINIMDRTFNNPDMEFVLKEPKILEIGKIVKAEDKFYSKCKYSNLMDMKMNSEEDETEMAKEVTINLLKLSFEQGFGEGNVNYNSETGFFEIYSEKIVYAISTNGKSDWKFLVRDDDQELILKKLIPEKILKME